MVDMKFWKLYDFRNLRLYSGVFGVVLKPRLLK